MISQDVSITIKKTNSGLTEAWCVHDLWWVNIWWIFMTLIPNRPSLKKTLITWNEAVLHRIFFTLNMSIPTTNPIKIPRTATPIAIPANCPKEKAWYELDEKLSHITAHVIQLIKIKTLIKKVLIYIHKLKNTKPKPHPKLSPFKVNKCRSDS